MKLMNNRAASGAVSATIAVAVIHPSLFVVKSMHMQSLKTKSPCGSNNANTQSLLQMVGGLFFLAAIHPHTYGIGVGVHPRRKAARYSGGEKIKIFIIVFLAWGFFAPFTYAAPAVVYVNAAYTAENSGGHYFSADAFAKIQEGVNAVEPGGVVYVAAGVYDEQVVIYKKNLTFKGEGDATVIQPSDPAKLTVSYAYPSSFPLWPNIKVGGIILILNADGSGVIMRDLKIDGSKITVLPFNAERLAGVLYGESAGIIENVTITTIRTSGETDRTYGIDINAVMNEVSVEIIHNRIVDFLRSGIQAVGKSLTIGIHQNIISGPLTLLGQEQTPNGIVLIHGPKGKVSGNIIHHFHSPGSSWRGSGILLWGDGFESTAVEDNEVYDTDYGIALGAGVNDFVVRRNRLYNNKTGVMLENGATNSKIVSNTITGNLQGFQIHGRLSSNPTGNKPPGAGNAAHENLIYENTYGVISFDDTQSFDAANNWWGSADPDFNKIISGSVVYSPWLVTKEGASLRASEPVSPAPTENIEELPEVEESLPPAPNQSSDGDGTGQAGGEAVARATPEEQTALFDVGVSPGDQQEQKFKKRISTAGANLATRIAPGEFLPVSVKLVNFGGSNSLTTGGGRRVDVTIDYSILNEKGEIVLTEKETVAVETTASFIKILQIPRDIQPGRYTAESSITYQGQKVPATASYQFTVERKIAGMFVSQFLIYGSVVIIAGILSVVVNQLIKKKLRAGRLTPHEYPEIAKEERIFYEITSDIIMQMRSRVGDKAIDIAKDIDDLVIDELNGKVLSIKKSPAKIIALLILKYEKMLGEKISFAFPKTDDKTKDHLASVEKNLVVIRKYFE